MATNIVQCDNCQKVVKQQEAHGWLEIRTWVTKPTPEQYDAMMQDPQWRAQFTASQLQAGVPMPPLIGGDFCTIDCLLKFAEGNRALLTMETTLDQQEYNPDDTTPNDLPDSFFDSNESAEDFVNRINKRLEGPDGE